MITLFDLRTRKTEDRVKEITALFDEEVIVRNSDNDIKACIGCWSCWVKTPGDCVFKDEMQGFYSYYVNSDKVILMMDTKQGFIDHTAKAFLDRTIPHYHPYIEIVDSECHHVERYEKYPEIYFYYDKTQVTDDESKCIDDYMYRSAYHFQSDCYRIEPDTQVKIRKMFNRKANNYSREFEKTQAMDRLIIYNGSPRRTGSNTETILSYAKRTLGESIEIRDLKKTDQWDNWISDFKKDENVMFILPLYVHAMPSHVMKFIEHLEPSAGSIAFIVQSGFPESSQSHYLEAYYERLATRLGRKYLGTAIKGGMEGLQYVKEKTKVKMTLPFVQLIHSIVTKGQMNPDVVGQMAKPIYIPKPVLMLFKIKGIAKLMNASWDRQLKSNNAYEKRFAKPYAN